MDRTRPRVLLDLAMSLDGAWPDLAVKTACTTGTSTRPPERSDHRGTRGTTGAIVIGRGAYGTGVDRGWDDTPYRVRHVVITHRPPLVVASRPVEFGFAGGLPDALDLAGRAAGERWVTGRRRGHRPPVPGRRYVDELQLHIVPVIVGTGLRLFDGSTGPHRLDGIRVVESNGVTHLRYRVRRPGGGRQGGWTGRGGWAGGRVIEL